MLDFFFVFFVDSLSFRSFNFFFFLIFAMIFSTFVNLLSTRFLLAFEIQINSRLLQVVDLSVRSTRQLDAIDLL